MRFSGVELQSSPGGLQIWQRFTERVFRDQFYRVRSDYRRTVPGRLLIRKRAMRARLDSNGPNFRIDGPIQSKE
jgi:hypothetical protein